MYKLHSHGAISIVYIAENGTDFLTTDLRSIYFKNISTKLETLSLSYDKIYLTSDTVSK